MYLIDTSVLIDFFKGKETKQTQKLEKIILHQIPFRISAFTYQELLQGAKDKKEFDKLKKYLSTQKSTIPTKTLLKIEQKYFLSAEKRYYYKKFHRFSYCSNSDRKCLNAISQQLRF